MDEVVIGAFEAKTHLSGVLEKVRRGQSFLVTRRGEPIARISPIDRPRPALTPGCAKGVLKRMADDFNAPIEDMAPYME